mmetsp:Transcript_143145/g.398894  ORF Transcript_143145/g.398894 Transcript_143145/m.398894 type:complete len:312 (+) Transcript_143145:307-1242(+)
MRLRRQAVRFPQLAEELCVLGLGQVQRKHHWSLSVDDSSSRPILSQQCHLQGHPEGERVNLEWVVLEIVRNARVGVVHVVIVAHETPDLNIVHKLWREKTHGAAHHHALPRCDNLGKTKIRQLGLVARGNEDVLRLHIAEHDLLVPVEVRQRKPRLAHVLRCKPRRQSQGPPIRVQLAQKTIQVRGAELQEEGKESAEGERTLEVHDEGVVRAPQCEDLGGGLALVLLQLQLQSKPPRLTGQEPEAAGPLRCRELDLDDPAKAAPAQLLDAPERAQRHPAVSVVLSRQHAAGQATRCPRNDKCTDRLEHTW